jgi:hypothetical protein
MSPHMRMQSIPDWLTEPGETGPGVTYPSDGEYHTDMRHAWQRYTWPHMHVADNPRTHAICCRYRHQWCQFMRDTIYHEYCSNMPQHRNPISADNFLLTESTSENIRREIPQSVMSRVVSCLFAASCLSSSRLVYHLASWSISFLSTMNANMPEQCLL